MISSNGTAKCPRCNGTFIADEFSSHTCHTLDDRGIVHIPIEYCHAYTSAKGESYFLAKSLVDGRLFDLYIPTYIKQGLTRKNPTDSEQNLGSYYLKRLQIALKAMMPLLLGR